MKITLVTVITLMNSLNALEVEQKCVANVNGELSMCKFCDTEVHTSSAW